MPPYARNGDDLDACVSLYVATFNAPPWNESWRVPGAVQSIGDFIATPPSHGVLATDSDDEPVGSSLGRLERSETEDHILLTEMCVRTEKQRVGRGTALLAALADQLLNVRRW